MKKILLTISLLSFPVIFSEEISDQNQKPVISHELIKQHKENFKSYVKKQKANARLYSEILPDRMVGYNSEARKCFPVGLAVLNDPSLDEFLDDFGRHDHDVMHVNTGIALLEQHAADKNKSVVLLHNLLVERLGLSGDVTPEELLALVENQSIDKKTFAFGVLRNLFVNYLREHNIAV